MIAACSIGAAAWHVAASSCAARVMGVTTPGVFLLAPPQRIVFVSFECYRSPLTINLTQSFDQLQSVEVGTVAQFSNNRLIFPSIEVAISLAEEVVWLCPMLSLAPQPRTAQLQTLNAIAAEVSAYSNKAGLTAVLPHLLDWPVAPSLSCEQSALLDRLLVLRHAEQVGDRALLVSGLINLLGQGRGLTPSGDDVIIGLLLMLTRSPRANSLTADNNLLQQVAADAYQKTTSISANLIECAAVGQGDERLIAVVDGIIAGSASIDECVACVLDWGSSSGIDALVGMLIAL